MVKIKPHLSCDCRLRIAAPQSLFPVPAPGEQGDSTDKPLIAIDGSYLQQLLYQLTLELGTAPFILAQITCSRLSIHRSKAILFYLIGSLTLEKSVDGTLVVRVENGQNKKASLTPVFITNKCPVLMFTSQVTLFKFILSKHYPAACKSDNKLDAKTTILPSIANVYLIIFYSQSTKNFFVKICLFTFSRNLAKNRGIGIEGKCKFSSLIFLSHFSENPHQKNRTGPACKGEAR